MRRVGRTTLCGAVWLSAAAADAGYRRGSDGDPASVSATTTSTTSSSSTVASAAGSTTIPGLAGSLPPSETEQEIARALFDMVNEERQARGLAPLTWSDELAAGAGEWNITMAAGGELQHAELDRILASSTTQPGGVDALPDFNQLGENIFRATSGVPAGRIHVAWMRSSGHRANILAETFTHLGVGVLCDEEGEVWATQRFGATVTEPPPQHTSVPPRRPITVDASEGPRCGGEPMRPDRPPSMT